MKRLLIFFLICSTSCNDNSENSDILEGDITISTKEELTAFGRKGYTRITGSLTIMEMLGESDIMNLGELKDLKRVDGNLRILENPVLNNLNGLQNLTEIGGSLVIRGNYELIGPLDGLESLRMIGESMIIEDQEQLDSIEGLVSFNSVNDVQITNTGLYYLNGLNRLVSLNSLVLDRNNVLQSLEGLENLESIDEFFVIKDNVSVQTLSALSNFRGSPKMDLEISGTLALMDLSGLEGLTSLKRLILANNDDVDLLTGLDNLREAEFLLVSNNKGLNKMIGLEGLVKLGVEETGQTLVIDNNEFLESMEGLQNVAEFYGNILITNNDFLTDFCDLKSILENGGSNAITISGNEHNPDEEAILSNNGCRQGVFNERKYESHSN